MNQGRKAIDLKYFKVAGPKIKEFIMRERVFKRQSSYKLMLTSFLLYIVSVSIANGAAVTINYETPHALTYPEFGFSLSSRVTDVEVNGNNYHVGGLQIYRLNDSLFNINSLDLSGIYGGPRVDIFAYNETGQIYNNSFYLHHPNPGFKDLNWRIAFLGLSDLTSITIRSISGSFAIDNIKISTSAVPIPAAIFMFIPVLLGFMGLRRRANSTVA